MKNKIVISDPVPDPIASGSIFTKYFRFAWLKGLFEKSKAFSILEIDQCLKNANKRYLNAQSFSILEIEPGKLNLFQEFIIHYTWSRQTMILQEQLKRKSPTYESSLVVEFQWFDTLAPEQRKFLAKYGLNDVITELEAFLKKWEYQPLKRKSHKVTNLMLSFRKKNTDR